MTRASKAKDKGLEPLAQIIYKQEMMEGSIEEIAQGYVNEEKGAKNMKEALQGAMDIIAEMISDSPEFRERIRKVYFEKGLIESAAVKGAEASVYEMYYEYKEAVRSIANHRILAVNRGEKEKILKVKVVVLDEEIVEFLFKNVISNEEAVTTHLLKTAIQDSYKRLIAPSLERETRSALTERAELEAIKVFAKNTKPLLLIPPVVGARILAVDPSFRTGCKLAVLDGTGKFLDFKTIYPNEPRNEIEKSKKVLKELIEKYDIDIIPIGNGTASRETEQLVAELIKEIDKTVYYTIVSEAGASVYSASKLATEEYPDLDVSIRGAISIGRRLQDPLAELVKIDTKHIGVGQYQHDLNQKKLDEALTNVVEDCVNSVGIDLNTASPSLLKYVSGISAPIAKNIFAYREENGKFSSRKELKKVKRLGDKAFEQCAGFLRITDGKNPLDNTAVHPESYTITEKLAEMLGYDLKEITADKFQDIDERIMKIEVKDEEEKTSSRSMKVKGQDKTLKGLAALKQLKFEEPKKDKGKERRKKMKVRIAKLAENLGVGVPTLKDIIDELKKPGRDPRDEMPKPLFRSDILKVEDLEPGMILTGTVRNVVDFGAFVDIGVKQDGLVHVSELSDKFIKNPMDVVSVGDAVKVKILKVDMDRGKVSLSMKGI